jgi:hypothetical protein
VLVEEIKEAGYDAAVKEAEYNRVFASARVKARLSEGKVTGDHASDLATIEAAEQEMAHIIAKNNLTTLRSSLSAKQEQLSALRTLAASHRAAGG